MRTLSIFLFLLLAPVSSWGKGRFQGAGSGLATPLVLGWMEGFRKTHPDLRDSFRTLSSTQALRLWMDRKVLFAAVETTLTPLEEKKLLARPSFQLPSAIVGLAVVYNVPGVPEGLKLSPGLLSRILAGKVGNWNHPLIVQMNPGWVLPPMPIQVLHREGLGLRDLLASLLIRSDPDWTPQGPRAESLIWPTGKPVQADGEALDRMRQWAGTIAVVDASFAHRKGLPTAAILNQAGRFVRPNPTTLAAAASDLARLPDNFQVILSGSLAPEAYPLSSFTWLMVHQDPARVFRDGKMAKTLVEFLGFILSQGQESVQELGLAPLPPKLRTQVLERVRSIKF